MKSKAKQLEQKLVQFALLNQPPEEVLAQAGSRLTDTIAASLGFGESDFGYALTSAMPSQPGGYTLWGSQKTVSVLEAAFINGCAAHAQDFDDTHRAGAIHASCVVVPATLVIAEQLDAPLDKVIAAIAIGNEVAVRLALHTGPMINSNGFHCTSVIGIFGAVAAIARLLEFSPDRLLDAWGIGASYSGGVHQYRNSGGDTKRLHAGIAARSAVESALLARQGITGPREFFTGREGVLATFAGMSEASERVARLADNLGGLGSSWLSLEIQAKRHPCCHYIQSVADAAIELSEQITTRGIERVVVKVPADSVTTVCEPIDLKKQIDPYTVKLSAYGIAALALVEGKIDVWPRGVQDAEVHRLMGVTDYEVLDVSAADGNYPGGVNVFLKSGQLLSRDLENPVPMTAQDYLDKARRATLGVLDPQWIELVQNQSSTGKQLANALRNLVTDK